MVKNPIRIRRIWYQNDRRDLGNSYLHRSFSFRKGIIEMIFRPLHLFISGVNKNAGEKVKVAVRTLNQYAILKSVWKLFLKSSFRRARLSSLSSFFSEWIEQEWAARTKSTTTWSRFLALMSIELIDVDSISSRPKEDFRLIGRIMW